MSETITVFQLHTWVMWTGTALGCCTAGL